ncbi:unnamed protein product [Cyprideis torosa]|uniref:Uncharacterized protein n=1 Tax=Cyprideis torosa TaxID=163714 RepID=A0A7R8W229_9CRUS|nr:unnamed protein product [Cyprideis torosa]CAG0881528.1 unnamed protein product [Cyprideis torosa]
MRRYSPRRKLSLRR